MFLTDPEINISSLQHSGCKIYYLAFKYTNSIPISKSGKICNSKNGTRKTKILLKTKLYIMNENHNLQLQHKMHSHETETYNTITTKTQIDLYNNNTVFSTAAIQSTSLTRMTLLRASLALVLTSGSESAVRRRSVSIPTESSFCISLGLAPTSASAITEHVAAFSLLLRIWSFLL